MNSKFRTRAAVVSLATVALLAACNKPADKDALLTAIEKVCKAGTEEMERSGRESVTAAGAAALPLLLDRYGKERAEDARDL